jgi:hypothetical protein
MIDTDFLDNIEWYVQEKPIIKNIKYRDTNENIDNETFENKIILNNENDYTIKFYVDDDLKLFKEKTFSGKQTLKTLFNIIYDFYQEKMDEEHINKIFENYPEIYEEIKRRRNFIYFKNIDGILDTEIPPDFAGIADIDDETSNRYVVELGPI